MVTRCTKPLEPDRPSLPDRRQHRRRRCARSTANDVDAFLQHADVAMYVAKDRGTQGFEIYSAIGDKYFPPSG